MKGYVYILSNPAMPGLVKIGKTTRSVEQRMEELYQTGVPCRFGLNRSELFPDCHSAERDMHELFNESRVNPSREFFSADLDVLKNMEKKLGELLEDQVGDILDEFMPDHIIRRPEDIIDTPDILIADLPDGVDFHDVSNILKFIDPAEWIRAKQEYNLSRKGGVIEYQDHECGI